MALMEFREPNQVKWLGSRPGHNGTQVLEHGSQTGVGTSVVYTVPAGVTLFLCAIQGGIYAPALDNFFIQIFNAVPVLFRNLWGTAAVAANFSPYSVSYFYPIEIPEAYSIRVKVGAAGNRIDATIHGWVE